MNGFAVWLIICGCISGILEEAEFYNIMDLIKLVKDKIRERDAKQNQVGETVTCWMWCSPQSRHVTL